MRRPSTFAQLYAWHKAAVSGASPDMHDGDPQCGWYKRQFVKNGPWVPVRIYVERETDPKTGELISDEVLRIEIEGLDAGDPAEHWTFLTPITQQAFDHLADYRLRDNRMLDNTRPMDLSQSPTYPQGVM